MKTNRRWLALLLSLALLCAALPMGVLNAAAESAGDFEYTVLGDNTVEITGYIGEGGEVTIPATIDGKSVTIIGASAFLGCESLTSITIPDGVIGIGDCAFVYCTSLTSITIPDSVTNIGGGAFSQCTSLASIMIPDSAINIGGGAFSNTAYYNNEENWEDSVLYIGSWLIEAKPFEVATCVIKEGTKRIANDAFRDCEYLVSITLPDSMTGIGDSAFENCELLTEVTIPDSVISIGSEAFSWCTSLTSITIPDGVTSIWEYAFYGCKSLTSVTIPGSVTSVGDWAFSLCTSLASVTILDGVTGIGRYAFQDCKSLAEVTIPGSVTSVGDWAFSGCDDLASITIPEGVDVIGEFAFENCELLTEVTIPDSVTAIGYSAFVGCSSLDSVTISDNVTSIGECAFNNTAYYNNEENWEDGVLYVGSWLVDAGDDKEFFVIKEGTKGIADGAFSYCDGLGFVAIPDSVTSMGAFVFSRDSSLAIYGGEGSCAQQYAVENDIFFAVFGPAALGDVDGNGKVNTTDARLTLQYAAGRIDATKLNATVADVDGNGKVNTTDARLILQKAAGRIEAFPAEQG